MSFIKQKCNDSSKSSYFNFRSNVNTFIFSKIARSLMWAYIIQIARYCQRAFLDNTCNKYLAQSNHKWSGEIAFFLFHVNRDDRVKYRWVFYLLIKNSNHIMVRLRSDHYCDKNGNCRRFSEDTPAVKVVATQYLHSFSSQQFALQQNHTRLIRSEFGSNWSWKRTRKARYVLNFVMT